MAFWFRWLGIAKAASYLKPRIAVHCRRLLRLQVFAKIGIPQGSFRELALRRSCNLRIHSERRDV